jgi:hypothetical protein
MATKTSETATIVRVCLEWLELSRIVAWRQNTGVAVYRDRRGKKRYVKYGFPGAADITGILPDGKRLEVECKVPGNSPSPQQRAFAAMIRAHGGVYVLAYELEDLQVALAELRYIIGGY